MATEKIYSSANSNPEGGLTITLDYRAEDKATGANASCGTGWNGETWEFEFMDVQAVLTGAVTDVQLNIYLKFTGWSNDTFYLEVYDSVAASWTVVETWDSGNPPPSVMTVQNEDVDSILSNFARLNGAKIRMRGESVGTEDSVTIEVDYVELVITYTPDSEENNYLPTTGTCEIYDWDEHVSGDQTSKTPAERSVTPTTIINYNVIPSDAEQNKTDDDDFENHTYSVGDADALYTRRCAIMIKTVVSETEGDVSRLDALIRGGHYYVLKTANMYIWNHVSSAWEQVTNTWGSAFETGASERPHTLKKDILASIGDYIDTDTIYTLVWDYSGQYSTGGCLHPDTLILTPNGYVKIKNIKLGDIVIGEFNGARMETKVIGASFHNGKWRLHNVEGIGSTDDHEFIRNGKKVRADNLTVEIFEYEGKVHDLRTETENYIGYAPERDGFFGKEVLIHNRLMKA